MIGSKHVPARAGLAIILGLLVLLGVLVLERSRRKPLPIPQENAVAAPEVTPAVAAGAQDLFEDVTARAGLTFVHQFCDRRLANIIESNGQGAAMLDYDSDGSMDIYLVNAGPLAGVTSHAPGRSANRTGFTGTAATARSKT